MSLGVSPGFYPDPLEPGRERWWDGERWGDQARNITGPSGRPVGPEEKAAERALPEPAPPWVAQQDSTQPVRIDPGSFGPGHSPYLDDPVSDAPSLPRDTFTSHAPDPAYVTPDLPRATASRPEGAPARLEGPLSHMEAGAWRPAGFWRRLGGNVLDFAVVVALAQLVVLATNDMFPYPLEHANYFRYYWLDDNDWFIPALDGLAPALWLLYRGLLEPTRLRTLGQRVFGMRTLSASTLAPAGVLLTLHRHSLVAAMLLAASYSVVGSLAVGAVLLVEHLMMLPKGGGRQTGHDRLAGTVVEVYR